MKLTGLLLCITLLQVSARSTAQRLSISVRNGSLEKVFSEIEKRTNYVFFYDASLLQKTKPVTIDMKDASVEDVLRVTFKGQGLDFSIQDRTIFIKREAEKAPAAPTASTVTSLVGGGPISIVVESDAGVPLTGATIYIKKLNKSGMTDSKGEFVLKGAPDGEYMVEITNIGFEKHIGVLKVINGEARLGVRMKQATGGLDEMVVKGYYATSKALNTGNVSIVSGEDIRKQPVSDPIQALEGRVPGLIVQQSSGVPGAYGKIQIRGQNSIANGNDPLYIIDGVPFSSMSLSNPTIGIGVTGMGNLLANMTGGGLSPFNALNPSDIENIEVLKDADATAIYGSRGANGVILISTKKGQIGDTKFDLNVFTGAGTVANKLNLLNTQQYIAMRREAFLNDKLLLPSITTNPKDNNYDINGVWDTTRYTDWQKALIGGTANYTNAQGNLSAGNENTRFSIGAGYSRQGTVFPGNYNDQKASVHVNVIHNSTNHRFGSQLVVSYINDNNNQAPSNFTRGITLAPDAPSLYDNAGNINWQVLNGTATFANPLATKVQKVSALTNNLISNLSLRYQLLKGLELKSNFGYNHDVMNQSQLTPATINAPPNSNLSTSRDNTFATTDFSSWVIEPQISYSRYIGQGRLDITTGLTFQQNKNNSLVQDANNFVSDALITNPQAASSLRLLGANYILYRYTAQYGRIGYDWREKYVLNLTARRDGSSRFGPGKQFGNFGAIGAAWIFSKEKFIQDHFRFLNFGKIRASYGTTGNDQIADYQFLSTYTATPTTYQGITGLLPARLTNPFFAWEVVKKLEGGIELGLLKNNRIFISASYFRNRTGNQLVGLSLPSQTGFTSVQYNLPAVVQNTGLEIVVSSTNIQSKNFEWVTTINLTIPSNKLVSFPGLANFAAYKNTYIVGESIFIKRVYQNTGVNPQTGLYSFNTKNANGFPSSPQDLVTTTKPVTQSLFGGVQNRFSYKELSLDVFVQFVNQIGPSYLAGFSDPGVSNANQLTTVLGRWQNAGNLTATQRFGTSSGSTYLPYTYVSISDKSYTSAGFVRIKNVSLSYRIPDSWKTKLHLQNARIYIQCQNLLTITRYLGLDPESLGVLNLPPLRMVAAGFQVGL